MAQDPRSPDSPHIRRVLAAWLVQLLYTLSPVDIVPDVVPVLGWMDDASLLLVVLAFTAWSVYTGWRHRGAVRAAVENLEQRGAELRRSQVVDVEYAPVTAEELNRL